MTVATIMTQIKEIDKLVDEYLELDPDHDQVSVSYTKLTLLCKYANEYKYLLLNKEVD